MLSVLPLADVAARMDLPNITGLTVITHGYQFPNSGGDSLAPLANAVRDKADSLNGAAQAWLLDYDVPDDAGQGVFDFNNWPLPGGDGKFRGELVLLFDWAPESNEPSAGWGEAAGDALFSMIVGLGIVQPEPGPPIAKPLHMIGHSFGTVVTSEAVERLAEFQVPVDQVTYLDPHDFAQVALPVDGSQQLSTLGKPNGYGATV